MKITEFLLELFYPSRCAFCRKSVGRGEGMCADCGKKLPYTGENNEKQHFANVKFCISPLYYEGAVREALLRYKFSGAAAYSSIFGKFMTKCIDETQISCDIITWVPLSRKRLRRRGYDQARLLAESVSEELSLPCERALRKIRNNTAQSGISDYARRHENVSGAYEAVNDELFCGKRVLLIDDIVTTGATLSETASVLKKAGAAEVIALTAARRRD